MLESHVSHNPILIRVDIRLNHGVQYLTTPFQLISKALDPGWKSQRLRLKLDTPALSRKTCSCFSAGKRDRTCAISRVILKAMVNMLR